MGWIKYFLIEYNEIIHIILSHIGDVSLNSNKEYDKPWLKMININNFCGTKIYNLKGNKNITIGKIFIK